MYYRIAWKQKLSTVWQWKSTRLTSLEGVRRFFWFYRAIPQNRLRVFSSPSREDLNELLVQANSEEASCCATAPLSVPMERNVNMLQRRRFEIEMGAGGDHDVPYTFALPASLSQRLAWIRLLSKVQRGELAQRF